MRPPDLRVRLADRSLRQTNPVLGVVAQLLDLADERLTASQVLDLADREPVRRRFRLDDDDLARIEDWVARERHPLGPRRRAPRAVQARRAAGGHVAGGLDRVLVGVAMTEEEQRLFGGVLPLDDVDSGASTSPAASPSSSTGCSDALDALATPKPIDAWAAAIADAADALTATHRARRLAARRARAACSTTSSPRPAGSGSATEPRARRGPRAAGRPARRAARRARTSAPATSRSARSCRCARCRTGSSACSASTTASFPRKAPRDGDDLMLADPHVGDRDARSEDRQLLLDALLAATDQLVITYTGNDERTNLAPAAGGAGRRAARRRRPHGADRRRPARERVVVEHPLQPFDPRNFTAGELVPERAVELRPRRRSTARGRSTAERAQPRAVPRRAAAAASTSRSSSSTTSSLRRAPGARVPAPAARHQRRRLRATRSRTRCRSSSTRWSGGASAQRLLDGAARRRRAARPRSRPRSRAGRCRRASSAEPVHRRASARSSSSIAARGADARRPTRSRRRSTSRSTLADGRTLSGTVPGVRGDVAADRRPTRGVSAAPPARGLGAPARADRRAPGAAVRGGHARPARAGRADGATVTVARIAPLADDAGARARCASRSPTLVDLYDRGMREPLPLVLHDLGRLRGRGRRAARTRQAAPRRRGTSSWNFRQRGRRARAPARARRDRARFDELLDEPPRADEQGDGWDADEPTRFGRYARRLWDGLLAARSVIDR